MDFKKILSEAKSTPQTAKHAIKIDKSQWMSIKEIAAYLDRSIYRTRQLGWDGKLGTVYQPEKEVYYARESVVAYKAVQDARGMKNSELDGTRTGKRIANACQLIVLIIDQDTAINATLKAQILTILGQYRTQAEEMIEDK